MSIDKEIALARDLPERKAAEVPARSGKRGKKKLPSLQFESSVNDKGEKEITLAFPSDPSLIEAVLRETTGSDRAPFSNYLLAQLQDTCLYRGDGGGECDSMTNFVTAAMLGIHPKDEIEGMLAAQLTATHIIALEMLRQSQAAQYEARRDGAVNRATKLLRVHRELLESFMRYRGKITKQKVIVEHVHVEAGAQAVVGVVQGREAMGEEGGA